MSDLPPDLPPNLSYHRRFADPGSRPSNRRVDRVVEHTRARVAEIAKFIDELEADRDGRVVAEAEAILHGRIRHDRLGDPGE